MHMISKRNPKAARVARLLIFSIPRNIELYQNSHGGQKPAAVMLSSDAVTVLWSAAVSPKWLIILMKHQGLNVKGVPLYRYYGKGDLFYLAEATA